MLVQVCYLYQSKEIPQALATLAINNNNDQSFYTDSGDTSQMTNNEGNLDFAQPYLGVDDDNTFPSLFKTM